VCQRPGARPVRFVVLVMRLLGEPGTGKVVGKRGGFCGRSFGRADFCWCRCWQRDFSPRTQNTSLRTFTLGVPLICRE
jgi:hypothetical protein